MKSNPQEIFLQKGYVLTVEILQGKAPPKVHRIYVIFLLSIFALICIIAQNLFPDSYSIFTNTISDQGCPLSNPNGYLLFNVGLILVGILMIPHFLYIFNVLRQIMPVFTSITIFFGIASSTGIILIGFFPQNIVPIHAIIAKFTFSAFFLHANGTFIILLLTREFLKSFRNRSKGLKIYLIVFNVTFIFLLIASLFKEYPPESPNVFQSIFTFSTWEWIHFLIIIGWLVGAFILVNQIELNKLEKRQINPWLLIETWLQTNRIPLVRLRRNITHN